MSPARKFGVFLVVLAAAGVAGGGAAYWHFIAGEVEDRLAQWEAERRADGFTINHGPVARAGFPFALTFDTKGLEIARGGELPLSWRAEALSARLNPWTLDDAILDFPGRHALVAPIEGRPRPIDVLLGEGRLDVLLAGPRPSAAALTLARVEAKLADTDEQYRVASARVVARRPPSAKTPAAPAPDDVSLETETRILGLALPPQRAGPLGPEISTVNMLANVIGLPPAAPTQAEAQRWRDAGGYVEIKEAQVVWGKVDIRGAGTARLDAALQPDVRIDGRVRGVDALIDALVAAGQMRASDAILAKGVLLGLSRPAEDGGPPVLRVPISVREGNRVYLGPVRVWRLPPLPWR